MSAFGRKADITLSDIPYRGPPNLLCLVSVVPRPSSGMVACTGEIS